MSKPMCSAIRADNGSKTEAGCTQPSPSRIRRNFWRRSVKDMAVLLLKNSAGPAVGRERNVDTAILWVLKRIADVKWINGEEVCERPGYAPYGCCGRTEAPI